MFIAFLPFLPAIGSAIAGLFKGGKGEKILDTAGKLAPVLGGAAKGRGGAQYSAERNQLDRDRLGLERYRMGLQAPRMRLGTSVMGSMAANAQPLQLGMVQPGMGLRGERPMSTGGMDAGMLSPETRQLAQQIMAQQFQQQLSGGGPPPIAGAPRSGLVDKLLGGGAFAGGILGALGPVFGKRPQQSRGVPVSQAPWERVRF